MNKLKKQNINYNSPLNTIENVYFGMRKLRPDPVEESHEVVVYHERNRHVQTHSAQSRHRSLVEGECALVLEDLHRTV